MDYTKIKELKWIDDYKEVNRLLETKKWLLVTVATEEKINKDLDSKFLLGRI